MSRQVGFFFSWLENSYAYCSPHYASPTFMCYCLFCGLLLISFGKFGKILQSGVLGSVGQVTLLNITVFAFCRIPEEYYFNNMRISLHRWEWMGAGFFFTRNCLRPLTFV